MFTHSSGKLYPILLTSLSAVMGVSLISPVLPEIKQTLQLSDPQAGLIITLYTLPAILLAPISGWLIDFYGRKTVLVPSLLLFGVSGVSISLISDFRLLLLLRFLQGIGGTSLALISRTLVGDVYSGSAQQTVMGINDSTLALGAALFPIVGGQLATVNWQSPFRLYVFPLVVSGIAVFLLEGASVESDSESADYVKNGLALVLKQKTQFLLAETFLSFFVLYGSMQTVAPLYLNTQFTYDSATIGFLITQMGLVMSVASFCNGYFSNHLKAQNRIYIGFGFYGLGLMVIGASRTYLGILAGFLFFGIGHGLILPALNTSIVRIVDDEQRGAMMAYRTIVARSGQTLGPLLFPVFGLILPYSTLFILLGILLLLTFGLLGFKESEIPND